MKSPKEKDDKEEDKWVTADVAMKMLRITSKATLQRLRDENWIKYAQATKKTILYDVDSINDFLDNHTKGVS